MTTVERHDARPMNRLGQGIIVRRKLTNRVMDKMSKGIGNHHSKKQHNKEQDKQHSLDEEDENIPESQFTNNNKDNKLE